MLVVLLALIVAAAYGAVYQISRQYGVKFDELNDLPNIDRTWHNIRMLRRLETDPAAVFGVAMKYIRYVGADEFAGAQRVCVAPQFKRFDKDMNAQQTVPSDSLPVFMFLNNNKGGVNVPKAPSVEGTRATVAVYILIGQRLEKGARHRLVLERVNGRWALAGFQVATSEDAGAVKIGEEWLGDMRHTYTPQNVPLYDRTATRAPMTFFRRSVIVWTDHKKSEAVSNEEMVKKLKALYEWEREGCALHVWDAQMLSSSTALVLIPWPNHHEGRVGFAWLKMVRAEMGAGWCVSDMTIHSTYDASY